MCCREGEAGLGDGDAGRGKGSRGDRRSNSGASCVRMRDSKEKALALMLVRGSSFWSDVCAYDVW